MILMLAVILFTACFGVGSNTQHQDTSEYSVNDLRLEFYTVASGSVWGSIGQWGGTVSGSTNSTIFLGISGIFRNNRNAEISEATITFTINNAGTILNRTLVFSNVPARSEVPFLHRTDIELETNHVATVAVTNIVLSD